MEYENNGYYVLQNGLYFLIKNDSFGVVFSFEFRKVIKNVDGDSVEFSFVGAYASSDDVSVVYDGSSLVFSARSLEHSAFFSVKDSSMVSFLVGEFSKLADYYPI